MKATIIRQLLRLAYVPLREDSRVLIETFFLSDPSIHGESSDEVRKHVERLVQIRWLQPTRDIVMKNHVEQPVTYRPTKAAFEWARNAWDDNLWDRNAEAMIAAIEKTPVVDSAYSDE